MTGMTPQKALVIALQSTVSPLSGLRIEEWADAVLAGLAALPEPFIITPAAASDVPMDYEPGRPALDPQTAHDDKTYMAGLVRGRELEREAQAVAPVGGHQHAYIASGRSHIPCDDPRCPDGAGHPGYYYFPEPHVAPVAASADADLLDEMSETWVSVERAIWPHGPAAGTGSGVYAALKARVIAAIRSAADTLDVEVREAATAYIKVLDAWRGRQEAILADSNPMLWRDALDKAEKALRVALADGEARRG